MKKFSSASVIWMLSVISIIQVQFVGAFVMLATKTENNPLIQYLIMAVVQVLNVLIVFFVRKKRNFVSSYSIKKISVANTVKSVVLGVVTFVGMYLISQYVFEFFVFLGVKAGYIDIGGWYVLPAIITTIILAPIGEELVFRSSLVYGFSSSKPYVAVIASSVAFALMHMSPMQTFYQLALGAVLAVLVMRSGNVVYPIIMHAVSNLITILLSFVPLPQIPLFHPLTVVVAVAVFVFCLLLAVMILRSIKKQESEEKRAEVLDESEEKKEKIYGITALSIGAFVCLTVWITAFF